MCNFVWNFESEMTALKNTENLHSVKEILSLGTMTRAEFTHNRVYFTKEVFQSPPNFDITLGPYFILKITEMLSLKYW